MCVYVRLQRLFTGRVVVWTRHAEAGVCSFSWRTPYLQMGRTRPHVQGGTGGCRGQTANGIRYRTSVWSWSGTRCGSLHAAAPPERPGSRDLDPHWTQTRQKWESASLWKLGWSTAVVSVVQKGWRCAHVPGLSHEKISLWKPENGLSTTEAFLLLHFLRMSILEDVL